MMLLDSASKSLVLGCNNTIKYMRFQDDMLTLFY